MSRNAWKTQLRVAASRASSSVIFSSSGTACRRCARVNMPDCAKLQPPPATDEPYAAERPMLPKNLPEALDALEKEPLFRRELGDTFIEYFIKLKRTEAGRYQRSLEESGEVAQSDEPSTWEQNEYFDFF